jgi:hypothetical protein
MYFETLGRDLRHQWYGASEVEKQRLQHNALDNTRINLMANMVERRTIIRQQGVRFLSVKNNYGSQTSMFWRQTTYSHFQCTIVASRPRKQKPFTRKGGRGRVECKLRLARQPHRSSNIVQAVHAVTYCE